MRRLYKILSFLLIITLLFAVCSCGQTQDGDNQGYTEPDREYNEDEVLSAAAELIERAKAINELYYGRGLEYDENYSSGIYSKATDESLRQFGISSVEELKSLTYTVFSDKQSRYMINTVLSTSNHGNHTVYSRYYDYDDNGTRVIMVNRNYDYYLKGSAEYHDGIRVKDVIGQEIVISVPVTVVSESGKTKDTQIEVRMLEEDDGWRFSSSCDAVYNESSDIYEDLEDELDKIFPD